MSRGLADAILSVASPRTIEPHFFSPALNIVHNKDTVRCLLLSSRTVTDLSLLLYNFNMTTILDLPPELIDLILLNIRITREEKKFTFAPCTDDHEPRRQLVTSAGQDCELYSQHHLPDTAHHHARLRYLERRSLIVHLRRFPGHDWLV